MLNLNFKNDTLKNRKIAILASVYIYLNSLLFLKDNVEYLLGIG